MNVSLIMEDVIISVPIQMDHTIVTVLLDSYWMMIITDAQVKMHFNTQIVFMCKYCAVYINEDHHECGTNQDNCDQNCHNTYGSYFCTCDSGWRLSSNDHTCVGKKVVTSEILWNILYNNYYYIDINECLEFSSGCNQICHNTPGSSYCTCQPGFILSANNHTCNGT